MLRLQPHFSSATPAFRQFSQNVPLQFSLVLLLAITLLGISASVSPTFSAWAASCSSLKSQLASLNTGDDGNSSRYTRAAKSQRKLMSTVISSLSSRGCSRKKKLFTRDPHSSCKGLRSTLKKMKGNLRALENKASRLKSGGRSSKSQRRKIKRAMQRNNCETRNTRANTRKTKNGRTSIAEKIFSNSASKKRRRQARKDRKELEKDRRRKKRNTKRSTKRRGLSKYNTVRTVCVRQCDGYFFPVSYSTSKSRVEDDAEACSNLCPGVEMELFFHKTSGETAEEMVSSVDGRPYASMPNAFAYRQNFDPECSCNYRLLARKQEVQPLTKPEQRATDLADIGRAAAPVWRIDPGQDPETLANAVGGLDDKTYSYLDPAQKKDKIADARRVRVIGESFLPVQ